jgi:hypothetical protein
MEGDITSQDGKGIIPRAVEALFEGVSQADENYEFTFKVSYVEIYLEKIRDLLDENRLKNNLTVREDKLKGVYIAGVTEEYVTSVQELLQIMHLGTFIFSLCSHVCLSHFDRCNESCDCCDWHERGIQSISLRFHNHCFSTTHH